MLLGKLSNNNYTHTQTRMRFACSYASKDLYIEIIFANISLHTPYTYT